MPSLSSRLEKSARKARDAARRRKLEAGESGWGAPVPPSPVLPSGASQHRTVAVIGAGRQGGNLAVGTKAIAGAELVAVADLDRERVEALAGRVGLGPDRTFTDAAEMLEASKPDLVAIATTAPYHVALGRLAKHAGAKRILLEKPIDNSYPDSAAFVDECKADGVLLAVNYIRRWQPDHRSIVRAIDAGQIGPVRIIAAQIGAGEVAMLGSHYLDFCRMVLKSEPVSISAQLRPRDQPNMRGADYDDPTGHVVVRFACGARAYLDFEDDLPRSDAVITIRGDHGMILVEENREVWTLRGRSGRTWTFPFAGFFRPVPMSTVVMAGVLTEDVAACDGADALAALEFVIAAHLSSQADGAAIRMPLTDEQRSLVIRFP